MTECPQYVYVLFLYHGTIIPWLIYVWNVPLRRISYFFSSFLYDQPHFFQLPPVRGPRLHRINASRVDAAVSQNVRQPDDILFQRVVGPGKEMAKIVGKYLALRHAGLPAQRLHIVPDIAPVQRLAVSGHKNRPGGDFLRPRVLQQRLPQLLRQEYGTVFPLIGHLRPAQPYGLHGKKPQLADPDAGGADALHHQQQPVVFPRPRRRQ